MVEVDEWVVVFAVPVVDRWFCCVEVAEPEGCWAVDPAVDPDPEGCWVVPAVDPDVDGCCEDDAEPLPVSGCCVVVAELPVVPPEPEPAPELIGAVDDPPEDPAVLPEDPPDVPEELDWARLPATLSERAATATVLIKP